MSQKGALRWAGGGIFFIFFGLPLIPAATGNIEHSARGVGTRSRAGREHLSTCSGTATSRESYSLIITAFCGVDFFFLWREEERRRRQRRWLPLCQRGKLVDDLFIPPETQAGRLCMCMPGNGFLRLLLLLLYTTR